MRLAKPLLIGLPINPKGVYEHRHTWPLYRSTQTRTQRSFEYDKGVLERVDGGM